jgi:uncharacterized membrane protein
MTFQHNSLYLVLAILGGIAYPVVVYFALPLVPPAALVMTGVGLICLRLAGMGRLAQWKGWRLAFLLAVIGLIVLLVLSPRLAAQAYPVAISLSVAGVFAVSLYVPPTIVERFARMSEPDLPPQGVLYCRKVTLVWIAFLLGNAGISMATALWGSLAQWTLWNGLLSYIAMGALFAGEFLVRRLVKRRARV